MAHFKANSACMGEKEKEREKNWVEFFFPFKYQFKENQQLFQPAYIPIPLNARMDVCVCL